jgi:uncharacterized protein YkwD
MRRARVLFAAVTAACALTLPAAPAHARSSSSVMLARVNAFRARHHVRRLHASGRLSHSAASYSRFLMARDWFGHMGIHASRHFHWVGEVLAIHTGGGPKVGWTLHAWKHSPGHRALLLSRRFHFGGFERTAGMFRGYRMTIWVGHLGAR